MSFEVYQNYFVRHLCVSLIISINYFSFFKTLCVKELQHYFFKNYVDRLSVPKNQTFALNRHFLNLIIFYLIFPHYNNNAHLSNDIISILKIIYPFYTSQKITLCIYSLHNVTVKLQPADIKSPLVHYSSLFIFPLHIIVYIYTLFFKQFALFSDYLFILFVSFFQKNKLKKKNQH